MQEAWETVYIGDHGVVIRNIARAFGFVIAALLTTPSLVLGAGTQALFDLSMPTGGPFPSDRFTTLDNSQKTGIRVEIDEIARDAFRSKVSTTLLSKAPAWDVLWLVGEWVPEFAKAGALTPVDTLLTKEQLAEVDRIAALGPGLDVDESKATLTKHDRP